jgi:hypothetical protein
MVRVVPQTWSSPSTRQTPRWIPGRSTAGATRTSAIGSSGSGRANIIGSRARSGASSASEIFGTNPSSRRRLAQKAASTSASISTSSGGGGTTPVTDGSIEA